MLRVWIIASYDRLQLISRLNGLLQPFLDRHPSVRVEWRALSWTNGFQELLRAWKEGHPPDVFEVGTTWIGMLAHLGVLAEVPAALTTAPLVAPWMEDVLTVRGTRFGVPWTLDCTCFYARADVLTAFGVPPGTRLTWEELAEICTRIAERPHRFPTVDRGRMRPFAVPVSPELGSLHRIMPWLWGGGWDFPDFRQRPLRLLSHADLQEGLAFLWWLMRMDAEEEEPYARGLQTLQTEFFSDGRYAFLTGGWWEVIHGIVAGVPHYGGRWPVTVLPQPLGPKGAWPYGGGSAIAVAATSPNKDVAWEMLAYLLRPDVAAERARSSYAVLPYAGPFWDEYAHHDEVQLLLSAVQSARHYPVHPLWRTIEYSLARGMSDLFWYLRQTPDLAMAGRMLEVMDEQLSRWFDLAWELEATGATG